MLKKRAFLVSQTLQGVVLLIPVIGYAYHQCKRRGRISWLWWNSRTFQEFQHVQLLTGGLLVTKRKASPETQFLPLSPVLRATEEKDTYLPIFYTRPLDFYEKSSGRTWNFTWCHLGFTVPRFKKACVTPAWTPYNLLPMQPRSRLACPVCGHSGQWHS